MKKDSISIVEVQVGLAYLPTNFKSQLLKTQMDNGLQYEYAIRILRV